MTDDREQTTEVERLRARVVELEAEVERLRRIKDDLSERTLELYSLFELTYSLGAAARFERLPSDSMDFVGELLGIEQFSLLLLDPEDGRLHVRAALGIPEEARQLCIIDPPEGVAGHVFTHQEVVYIPDVTKDPRYLYYKGFNTQGGSLLAVPLLDDDQNAFGVLNISKPEVDAFSPRDQALFGTVALQIAVMIQNYTSFRHLRRLSMTDELTGVSNRRAFFDAMDCEHREHRRVEKPYSVLLIDIDYFKQFNDRHGHLEGDLALRTVADLLANRCRAADLLARYGGEEFVVCARRTSKADGEKLAHDLRETVAKHRFALSDGTAAQPLSITVGVATYPDDDLDFRGVLDKADQALYYGKTKGRNAVVCFPLPDEDLPAGRGAKGDMPSRRGKGVADD